MKQERKKRETVTVATTQLKLQLLFLIRTLLCKKKIISNQWNALVDIKSAINFTIKIIRNNMNT